MACNVLVIFWLRCVVHVVLFAEINILYFCVITFKSMCAVPSLAVFCGSLLSCFPGMLFRYFLNYFEMVSVALLLLVSLLFLYSLYAVFLFCGLCILKSFRPLSWTHFCVLKLRHILTYMFFSVITDCDIRYNLIVRNGSVSFHLLIPLPPRLVPTNFGTCAYVFVV